MKTPFKTQGIYARRINSEKELNSFKPTKFESIWKAAIGEKEELIYKIIWFSEIPSNPLEASRTKQYCADYANRIGEIFELADWLKTRGSSYAEYQNIFFDEKKFEFGNDKLSFIGGDHDDILYLIIKNKITGESVKEQLRYIPWI